MALLRFSQFAPDLTDLDTDVSDKVQNVYPRADGYGPAPDFATYSSALPSACRGYIYARNSDGSISVFAGTSTNLYKLDNTTLTWTNVSLGGGPYATLVNSDHWRFVQFNNFVVAVQVGVAPQVYDLTVSSAFANLGGSPPQAGHVSVVNRFLVLTGISGFPYRVQWSGLNAITTWDNVTAQSNFQDLPDGGLTHEVAGTDTYGVIFQDSTIRLMIFAPGSPYTFQIERLAQDDGSYAQYSVVRAAEDIFFISPQGFKRIAPGGYPEFIGKEKIDRTFFADVDTANLQLVLGAVDPTSTRVYWAYKSLAGQAGLFDKVLVYDRVLKRFAPLALTGEFMASLSKPGLTLEGLDAIAPGGSLDALPFSLDSFSTATQAQISMVNSDHKLGFLSGSNLEAIIETTETDLGGQQMFLGEGIRVFTDAATVYSSLWTRANPQAAAVQTSETAINALGVCPTRVEGRYARARVRIPAGTSWTYAMGVEPINPVAAGER